MNLKSLGGLSGGLISHLGHEVAGVPGVQLSVGGEVPLLALLLLQPDHDSTLLVAQRLQFTSQLL